MLVLMFSALTISTFSWSVLPLLIASGIALALAIRTAHRARWKSPDLVTRVLYALHSHLQQIPILFGQLKYLMDRRRERIPSLIEYKG